MTRQPVWEGDLTFEGGMTHFRVVGTLESSLSPLIVVHGGPGMTWDYLEQLDRLASDRRAIIYYDQVGNGRSRPVGNDAAGLVTLDLLINQLEHLVHGIGIASRYSILAHSAGGIIALEHAMRKPIGLTALVLANAFASTRLMKQSLWDLRAQLPVPIREILDHNEAVGTTDSPHYAAATAEFMKRHVCRVNHPTSLMRTFAAVGANPHVHSELWGPSLFDPSGTFFEWTSEGRLSAIRSRTLVYRGEFDEVGENCLAPFADIPDAQRCVFAGASHLPHIETPLACLPRIASFLEAG